MTSTVVPSGMVVMIEAPVLGPVRHRRPTPPVPVTWAVIVVSSGISVAGAVAVGDAAVVAVGDGSGDGVAVGDGVGEGTVVAVGVAVGYGWSMRR